MHRKFRNDYAVLFDQNIGHAYENTAKRFCHIGFISPALVWTSDLVGSGEVILTTRSGAILGTGVIWAILIGIFLKCWIGISGARYTVCTGEGMIDMFSRIPGPRNRVVWMVMVIQFMSAMDSLASASGAFLHSLIPIPSYTAGWIISIPALLIVRSGGFKILKIIMSFLVALICIGIIYVAIVVFPPLSELVQGLLFQIPRVPEWASTRAGVSVNPWREILPLMGWAAGGFGSQVWYSCWVMGEDYGAAQGRGYGRAADLNYLKSLRKEDVYKIIKPHRIFAVFLLLAVIVFSYFCIFQIPFIL